MRRAFCALVGLLAAAFLAPAALAGTNLLPNPSFEGSLSGWNGWNSTLQQASDGTVGAGAAKVTASSGVTSFSIYTSPRPVSSTAIGTTYTATGWARSATPGRSLCIRIREWSSAGAVVGFSSLCATSASTWQQLPTVSYTTQSAGGTVETFVIETGAVAGDSFEIDGMSLSSGAAPAPDTTAPTVALTAPADGARVAGAVTVSASASDDVGVAKVEFLARGTVFATDTSAPYSATWSSSSGPDGAATLSARASDAAGNAATASRSVTVDNTGPDTSITSGPPASTTSTSASFSFAASESPATFQCALDGAAWQPCASPTTYSGLTAGSHSFAVRARDSLGNPDPSPATQSWSVSGSTSTGGTNLLPNPSFEGSLNGWGKWNSTLVLASDGVQGPGAAKVTNAAANTSFSINTSPRPVQYPPAGTTYVATAWQRSATPGKQLCLRIREWSAAGAQIGTAGSCVPSSSGWQQIPSVSYTAQGGASLEVYAILTGAVSGNSFELDAVSLTVGSAPPPPPPPPPGSDPTILAAGDIASCSSTGDEATANVLDAHSGYVATLGDNAYENGTAAEFANCYNPTWGRSKDRTHPATGNHDYGTAGAAGYFGYFGAAAGPSATGYYSYDLGAWHVVVLNSNCSQIGGCGAGSAQEQWLRGDLASHPTACTLAYWHHPRFHSIAVDPQYDSADADEMRAIWQALYDYGADVVLNAHTRAYERFAPQTPAGASDPTRGVREFIAGTAGRGHHTFGASIAANSQVRNDTAWGVLQLTLHSSSYDWQFLPVAGQTFTDSGTSACH